MWELNEYVIFSSPIFLLHIQILQAVWNLGIDISLTTIGAGWWMLYSSPIGSICSTFALGHNKMSICEDMLLCNYRKCRVKLSGYAWVTACSHIFCDQHGSGEFSRSPAVCPACSSALSGKLDIVRTELSPSEEYKAMVLSGLRPEIILDISSRALAFWTYQVNSSWAIAFWWEEQAFILQK